MRKSFNDIPTQKNNAPKEKSLFIFVYLKIMHQQNKYDC